MVKDIVCGMTVDEEYAPDEMKSEYEGSTYYFCSTHCREKFEGNPLEFIENAESTGGES